MISSSAWPETFVRGTGPIGSAAASHSRMIGEPGSWDSLIGYLVHRSADLLVSKRSGAASLAKVDWASPGARPDVRVVTLNVIY